MTEEEKKHRQDEAAEPVYAGTYEQQMQQMYERMSNRGAFKYNPNEDALWNSYKDSYVQLGRLSMRDTAGQAASLTGGYGSSYSQAVGQQQYDEYMRRLTDRLPELYGISRSAYEAEGEGMLRQYELLGGLRDTEYGQYRDALSDYRYALQQVAEREKTAYERQQDAYDSLLYMIKLSGYRPSDAELSGSGMSRERADAAREAWRLSNPEAAYVAGELTAEEYYSLTGRWPAGYALPVSYSGGGSGGGSKKVSAYNVAKTMINGLQSLGADSQAVRSVISNTAAMQGTSRVSALTSSQITKLEKLVR